VDTFLAIASKRDTRRYSEQPIPEQTTRRILDAGRLAGSAKNRQRWSFLLVESAERREALADAVYEPGNVRGAQLVVAIIGSTGFDTGRCIQNMMLAAWNEGVASCPNGLADAGKAQDALGLGENEPLAVVLTFGYADRGRAPDSRSADEWSARADRRSLDKLVRRL
jgi:nitroreductase